MLRELYVRGDLAKRIELGEGLKLRFHGRKGEEMEGKGWSAESPAVQNVRGLKRGLFTSNALKGGWDAFYGDLMAGVATPEEASEGW